MIDEERRRACVDDLAEAAGQLLALTRVGPAAARRGRGDAAWRRARARSPTSLRCPWVRSSGIASAIDSSPSSSRARIRRVGARDRPRKRLLDRRPRGGPVRGDREVLAHAQIVEQLERLPGPREPAPRARLVAPKPSRCPPVQLDRPAVRDEPGDRVDERRLARAVRADQTRRAGPPRPSRSTSSSARQAAEARPRCRSSRRGSRGPVPPPAARRRRPERRRAFTRPAPRPQAFFFCCFFF